MELLLIRNVFSNLGDEAMLHCEIMELKELTPRIKLTVLTDNPATVEKNYAVNAGFSDAVLATPFSAPSLRLVHKGLLNRSGKNNFSKALSVLSSKSILPFFCDTFVKNARRLKAGKTLLASPAHHRELLRRIQGTHLIIGGGGLVPSIREIYRPKKALYEAARILEKPVLLHGQTILPEIDPDLVKNINKIILRDSRLSRQNALRLGAEEENLISGLDPAFFLETHTAKDFPQGEIAEFIREPFIAVNLRDWKKADYQPRFRQIAEALNSFSRRSSIKRILFFGMQMGAGVNDFKTNEKMRKYLSGDWQTSCFPPGSDSIWLKTILGKAFCVISLRYHGAVFALTQAVPTVSFSVSAEYDVKLRGVFQMFGAEEFLHQLEKIETSQLISQLDRIAADRTAIVDKLRQKKEKLAASPRLKDVLLKLITEEHGKYGE